MVTRILSSLQHPIVKYWVKLREDKGFRRLEKRVCISGLKLIQELIDRKVPLLMLIYTSNKAPDIEQYAQEAYQVSEPILKKITGLQNPEPIAAIVEMPPFQHVGSAQRLLILDGISDPGNLGTLLRSALAFGWDGVFITEHSCDPFNDKAIRAAKGATFFLPLQEGSWEEWISLSRSFHVYVADMEGTLLDQVDPQPPTALVLSRESSGARSDAIQRFTPIAIPMQPCSESLNVASAGAILLYHLKGSL